MSRDPIEKARADRLKEARIATGFRSASAAAKHFRWSYQTYYSHENSNRSLVDKVARYAKAFRVSEAWLLTGEGRAPGGPPAPDGLDELIETYGDLTADLRWHLLQHALLLRDLARLRGEEPPSA
jgi:hypothetical protein